MPPPGSGGDHTGSANNRESPSADVTAITCHNPRMPAYAAFLRGINVGRNKRIGMADLRALMEGLGHASVRTHLQSGNIVFESPKRRARPFEAAIEQAIVAELGMDVTVVVRCLDEFVVVVVVLLFGARIDDFKKVHVVFFSKTPKTTAI